MHFNIYCKILQKYHLKQSMTALFVIRTILMTLDDLTHLQCIAYKLKTYEQSIK